MLFVPASCEPRAQLVRAKNIDYTPDLTSDSYWDAHHICVVRVNGLGKDAEGKPQLTYQVVGRISEALVEEVRTVRLSDLWFGMYVEEPPRIGAHDNLVIYYAREGPSPIVATKLDAGIEESPLVKSLRRIAGLRAGAGGPRALREAALSADALVALYSLKRLLAQPPSEAGGDYAAQLMKVRDDEGREAQVRLLAGRLAYKLEGKSDDSAEEYAWLRAAIIKSKEPDWAQLKPLLDRLLEFEGRRAENVAFLTHLVGDPNAAQATRIAAYSSFEDRRLFRFDKPDAESDSVFEACIGMLKDPDPVIRGAGAALLHNLSVQIDAAAKRAYVERAKSAIGAAIAVETNAGTQGQLKSYLKLLS
jgi:hypothetical protein